MYEFSRRAFIKFLGKITAALGMVFSLGTGCAKEEGKKDPDKRVQMDFERMNRDNKERRERALKYSQGRKYITALCCGSDGGYCETFLSAAAMGAAEFGIETELIKAATLDVNVLEAYKDDDVPWIHEKTIYAECPLIVAVPCYSIRANALFYAIDERGIGEPYPGCNTKTRLGAVIGVGGSGYDAWASLVNISTQLMMQHTRKVVDQVQFNFCGLREWNLWMQQDQPLTSHTHLARCIDEPWDKVYNTLWGKQPDAITFFKMAVERAKQLGRNVAQAMNMPIEDVEYKGQKAGVECPVCHCNILLVPEDLPYVGCPICWIRGTIVDDNGKMKVNWHMEDLKLQRFSSEGEAHHMEYTGKIHRERTAANNNEIKVLKNEIFSQRKLKVISPYV
jgi:hypothetical protein